MELVDALKEDLGKELAVIDIYQKYVKQIHDPVVRKIFMQLISESMGHADTFRQLLYKKTLGIDLKRSGLSDVALSNLLYFGMKEEREMRKVYEKQLPFLGDKEYAETIKRIISDEQRHEQMLKEAYARLKNANP